MLHLQAYDLRPIKSLRDMLELTTHSTPIADEHLPYMLGGGGPGQTSVISLLDGTKIAASYGCDGPLSEATPECQPIVRYYHLVPKA